MDADWGELTVGPCGTLTQTVPGLTREVGCVRGQALPCMEGHSIEQEDFLKKKKTLRGTLGNSPAAISPVSSPPRHPSGECVHRPGSVCTASWRELRLQAPTRGVCRATGLGLETGECAHPPGSVRTSSGRELRPQAPGRVRINEGPVCTPIAQRRPTIKKEWAEAGNTRILPGRGNPPTDKKSRR